MPGWCPCLYVWHRLPRPYPVVPVAGHCHDAAFPILPHQRLATASAEIRHAQQQHGGVPSCPKVDPSKYLLMWIFFFGPVQVESVIDNDNSYESYQILADPG